jgi:hypothetical protein
MFSVMTIGAQILELLNDLSSAHSAPPWYGNGNAEFIKFPPAMLNHNHKGRTFAPVQAGGNRAFPKRFPQVSA